MHLSELLINKKIFKSILKTENDYAIILSCQGVDIRFEKWADSRVAKGDRL